MAFHISTVKAEGFITIIISGNMTKKDAQAIFQEIIEEVRRSKPDRVLVDLRNSKGRPGIASTYMMVRDYPINTPRVKTAIVDLEENKEFTLFYESVAVNWGYPTRCFDSIDEAEKWLRSGTTP
ncbi:MAG: hypothetical protein A4E62_02366 [Syntrophorhabdus sp. PtaU1.Bin002]|nr:MAG: hypothetical protein A4E58_03049 [Syntrophorhabdus sp. PtaB.Bin006]OPY67058.1 MAG: hypothetical protein A4E62_02366 [Syntrophorhabdus sp. PtaU1.Bin002]